MEDSVAEYPICGLVLRSAFGTTLAVPAPFSVAVKLELTLLATYSAIGCSFLAAND